MFHFLCATLFHNVALRVEARVFVFQYHHHKFITHKAKEQLRAKYIRKLRYPLGYCD